MAASRFISPLLTAGGDARIVVPATSNTNIYGASPFPRSTLGYAASTANDISLDAFRHLDATISAWPAGDLQSNLAYQDRLECMRGQLRQAWGLPRDCGIVFAASGTELEYVALALALARQTRPVTNILLGRDEVGSGCILSAAGRYFARQSPVCPQTPLGAFAPGFEQSQVDDIGLRDRAGRPLSSPGVTAELDRRATLARSDGRHPIVHAVHGSKTGLILPSIGDVSRLHASHGEDLTIVVDACQARIEAAEIRRYLAEDCIVMTTGSKFMGGPPFSGIALVPTSYRPNRSLAEGMATIFRRAEWPGEWHACDHLPATANPGLLLRLEAALFELSRFQRIERRDRDRVISHFGEAIIRLADRLGVSIVEPFLTGKSLHDGTLATLDLSAMAGRPDFAVAQRWHRVLAARGLRLGQPVKCVPMAGGGWAGTLRISLSMPLISTLAGMSSDQLAEKFGRDFGQIANVLEAAQRPVAV